MLNVIYLVLLSDINLLFGFIAMCLAPYYIKTTNIRLDLSPFTAIFLFAIGLSFVISINHGIFGINLLCMLLYLFRFSFYTNRFSVPPSYVIFIFSSFTFLQILQPEQIGALRNLISDDRVDVVDYSLESIVGLRFSGLFTNPNYFAIVIILLYVIELIFRRDGFSKFLNLCVLLSVAASGSRSALGCYLIITAFLFFYIKSSRSYFLVVAATFVTAFIYLSNVIDLRFLQVQDILTNSDPSSSLRTEVLSKYLNDMLWRSDYISLIFGHGYADQYNYFFDGDVGNLLYLMGFFGCFAFLFVIINKYKMGRAPLAILALFPFVLAGGIFGNLKTLFIFAILPDLFIAYAARYPLVRDEFLTQSRTRSELRNY